jgi:hypothetical protein
MNANLNVALHLLQRIFPMVEYLATGLILQSLKRPISVPIAGVTINLMTPNVRMKVVIKLIMDTPKVSAQLGLITEQAESLPEKEMEAIGPMIYQNVVMEKEEPVKAKRQPVERL